MVLSACSPGEFERHRAAIVGGMVDSTQNAVFLLELVFDDDTSSICSAALVSPRVLLTAAHCIDIRHQKKGSVKIRAMNRPNVEGLRLEDMFEVSTHSLHPQWVPLMSRNDFDLAALLLSRAPQGVTPFVLSRSLVFSAGQLMRVVGYGRSTAAGDDSGVRRVGSAPVGQVTARTFEIGAAGTRGICAGDSGGPSLMPGNGSSTVVIAGIHSVTLSAQCGLGADIRIDSNLGFIEDFIARHDSTPMCPADGVCQPSGCQGPDVDCQPCQLNGVCESGCGANDADCLPDGDVCSAASTCAGALCLPDSRGFQYCASSCTASDACTRQMVCIEGQCRLPAPETAPVQPAGGCAAVPMPVAVLMIAGCIIRRKSRRGGAILR